MLRFRSAPPISRGARFSLVLIVACSCCGISSLAAKRRKPLPTTTPQNSKEDFGLKNIPLTVGHAAKGLVLPNYDQKGHLLGRFEAATASRIDEQHVHFSGLKIVTYDGQQKPDFNIDMSDAVLNLDTRVISSNRRTEIKRNDFEIAGDSMQFNTSTHQGTLVGNVHMTIFNQSHLTGNP
jgi:hypothetical protein